MAHRKPTSTSAKILYRPVGLASGILSGALSGVLFKQLWKVASPSRSEDTHRAVAPLRQAADAVLLDTSAIGLEESYALLKKTVLEHIA